jgi:hypothetical protein
LFLVCACHWIRPEGFLVRKDASDTEQEQDLEQREASWNGGTTGGAGLGVGAARRATERQTEGRKQKKNHRNFPF